MHTLQHVRDAGMNVCCGGIVGMEEDADDRVGLLMHSGNTCQNLLKVCINNLVPGTGTPWRAWKNS
ncbi:MAG: hypothetical protein ACFHHU_13430 [Porticoccaceae bacterium]